MTPVPQKLAALLDELRAIDDRELKFDLLIEFSDRFKEVSPDVAVRPFPESHKAPACESEAYGWVTKNADGTVKLHFAVENPQGISAKALAAILDEGLSGATPKEVQAISEELIYDIFGRSISMGKGQGLMGMVRIVKHFASQL